MISDDSIKKIMEHLGMPQSRSLYQALIQAATEGALAERARINDEEPTFLTEELILLLKEGGLKPECSRMVFRGALSQVAENRPDLLGLFSYRSCMRSEAAQKASTAATYLQELIETSTKEVEDSIRKYVAGENYVAPPLYEDALKRSRQLNMDARAAGQKARQINIRIDNLASSWYEEWKKC